MAINPNGRVPVLVDGDLVLWESTSILRYLAGKAGSSLLPTDRRAQAEVDRWLSWQLAHLGPAMTKVAFERIVKKVTGQGAPDEAAVAAGAAEFAKLAAILDGALAGREYLAGALSVADFALAAHFSLRIPLHLGIRSAETWAVVPEHMGARSERSDEWGWSGGGLRLSGGESFLLSHRGSAKREHVGVVHEAVADGVGDRGIAEGFMPTFGR